MCLIPQFGYESRWGCRSLSMATGMVWKHNQLQVARGDLSLTGCGFKENHNQCHHVRAMQYLHKHRVSPPRSLASGWAGEISFTVFPACIPICFVSAYVALACRSSKKKKRKANMSEAYAHDDEQREQTIETFRKMSRRSCRKKGL